MRKKGLTYSAISKKTSLSQERIRQICNEVDLVGFYRTLEEEYKRRISDADYNWIKTEVAHLRKHNRSKEEVIRRKLLIRYLHNNLEIPFYKIGALLKRHHTSISHSYYSIS